MYRSVSPANTFPETYNYLFRVYTLSAEVRRAKRPKERFSDSLCPIRRATLQYALRDNIAKLEKRFFLLCNLHRTSLKPNFPPEKSTPVDAFCCISLRRPYKCYAQQNKADNTRRSIFSVIKICLPARNRKTSKLPLIVRFYRVKRVCFNNC